MVMTGQWSNHLSRGRADIGRNTRSPYELLGFTLQGTGQSLLATRTKSIL
jgi:hypothetical protein